MSFRIHFSGGDIIESPYQRQAWEELCSDSHTNKNLLGVCTENDLERLDDILDCIKG